MPLTLRNLNKALVDYLAAELPDVKVEQGRFKEFPDAPPCIWVWAMPASNDLPDQTGFGNKTVAHIVIGCFKDITEDLFETMILSIELAELVEEKLKSGFLAYVATLPEMAGTFIYQGKNAVSFEDFHNNTAVAGLELFATYAKLKS